MSLTYTAAFDERSLKAPIKYLLGPTMQALYFTAALIGAFGVLQVLEHNTSLAVGLIGGAIFIVVVFPRPMVRRSVEANMRTIGKPTTYDFGPEGIGTRNELYRTLWSWAAVTTVDDRPGYLVVRLLTSQSLLVPTGGLHPEQLATLRRIVGSRGATTGAGREA